MRGVLLREGGRNERHQPSPAARTLGAVLLVDDRSCDRRPIVHGIRGERGPVPTLLLWEERNSPAGPTPEVQVLPDPHSLDDLTRTVSHGLAGEAGVEAA